MSELKIVAVVVVKAAFQSEMEAEFHKVVDGTRKESGNVSYELHQGIQNPLRYTILEVWKSQDAIDSHNKSAHFIAFANALEGKIDSLSIDIIKKIY